MTELTCILCPRGCRLHIEEAAGYTVTGNACGRGLDYGKKELQNPTRTLTSTVRIQGAALPRLPVKTDREIPKKDVLTAASLLNGITLHAPVQVGDVIVANVLGTGANIVATRHLPVAAEPFFRG